MSLNKDDVALCEAPPLPAIPEQKPARQRLLEAYCTKCANLGKVNALSQETFCSQCCWHEKWRVDHFVRKE